VLREHAADDVFVDIDTKGPRNLLCDAGTANTGIAALELDDRVNEFFRWPFWARAPMTTPPVFGGQRGTSRASRCLADETYEALRLSWTAMTDHVGRMPRASSALCVGC
jgi:hypothetical protein